MYITPIEFKRGRDRKKRKRRRKKQKYDQFQGKGSLVGRGTKDAIFGAIGGMGLTLAVNKLRKNTTTIGDLGVSAGVGLGTGFASGVYNQAVLNNVRSQKNRKRALININR